MENHETNETKQPDKSADREAAYYLNKPPAPEKRLIRWQQDKDPFGCFRRDTGMFSERAEAVGSRSPELHTVESQLDCYLGLPHPVDCSASFDRWLDFWEERMADDIIDCMKKDGKKCIEAGRIPDIPDFDLDGWRRSLFYAWITLRKLRSALNAEGQNDVLYLSFQLGQLIREYTLRKSFDAVVLTYKAQCSPLVQKRMIEQDKKHARQMVAIAEFQRRHLRDPNKSATSLIEDMAEEKVRGKHKYGSKRTLMKYGLSKLVKSQQNASR